MKERRVYQPYIRLSERPRSKGRGKKKSRLQKGRINKNIACSTVQGKDELSQIKKKREKARKERKKNRRVKGYSVHLYRISFSNGFSSRH